MSGLELFFCDGFQNLNYSNLSTARVVVETIHIYAEIFCVVVLLLSTESFAISEIVLEMDVNICKLNIY